MERKDAEHFQDARAEFEETEDDEPAAEEAGDLPWGGPEMMEAAPPSRVQGRARLVDLS